MSSRLNPYINFRAEAAEALEFYRSVLGGTVTKHTFAEFGMDDPEIAENIMHGQLVTEDDFVLMISDLPPQMELKEGNNITIALNGDDEAKLRGYFDKLSEGATVNVPLEKQMWGDLFGSLTDKFGIAWLVNIGVAPQQ